MGAERAAGHSRLFTIRAWIEDLCSEESEVRGQVTDAVTGATRHFRTMAQVKSFLTESLRGAGGTEAESSRSPSA